MIGSESFRMSLASLWSHKMRSVLTITGVVIGVGAVIAVVSLGAAFEESITSEFDTLDDRTIFVTASATDVSQGPPNAGQFGLIFTEEDRQRLAALDGVERVLASGQVTVSGLASGDKELPFRSLTGTTSEAEEIRHPEDYASGGVFEDGQQHVVLGWNIAKQLSSTDEPLQAGDTITVSFEDGSSQDVTIAGVLASQDSFFGSNNGQVFAPIDPFYDVKRTSPNTDQLVRVFEGFTVIADDPRTVAATRDDVRDYMENDSDASQLLAEDLAIFVATPADIQEGISSAFDQVTIFIAAIAATSLLVGGIMIGTIMLISVTERTREIGIMKAIGARNKDVLWLFLVEAGIIGLVGSIIGLALGLGAGYGLVEGLFGSEDVGFVVPWDWVAISMAVGIVTGMVAGFFPARRATRIQPVEALSYE